MAKIQIIFELQEIGRALYLRYSNHHIGLRSASKWPNYATDFLFTSATLENLLKYVSDYKPLPIILTQLFTIIFLTFCIQLRLETAGKTPRQNCDLFDQAH